MALFPRFLLILIALENSLKGTDWGDLDVLVLDLPPGTGDVQLAVLQQLQLSGAVAVTTPSKLAITDTKKGIEMFTSLGVPTLAVVENLSFFAVCPSVAWSLSSVAISTLDVLTVFLTCYAWQDDTGKIHYPFGRGFAEGGNGLSNDVEMVQLPISIAANDANERGVPLTISRPDAAVAELTAYRDLARLVSRELLLLQYGSPNERRLLVVFDSDPEQYFDVASVTLSLDKSKGAEKLFVRLVSDSTAVQRVVSPALLRSRNPKTGDTMADSPFLEVDNDEASASGGDKPVMVSRTRKRSPSIIPTKVERRGRYGFAVEWGDGATIIYSVQSLARAAGGTVKQENL
jgi:NUBPL iron-transfer P-loop NTPase